MFSKIRFKQHFRTLAFRLTFSYTYVFAIVSLCGFLALYFCIKQYLFNQIDNELLEEYHECGLIVQDFELQFVESFFYQEAEAEDDGSESAFFRLMNKDNEVVAASDMRDWPVSMLNTLFSTKNQVGTIELHSVSISGEGINARIISGVLPQGLTLQIGFLIDRELEFLSTIKLYSAMILLCILLAGFIVGRNMSQMAIRGIKNVTNTANQIADGQFEKRVVISRYGEEIEDLACAFNQMTEKISALLHEMAEMNDNIAHDLRSPLARIHGLAEEKLMKQDVSEDCRTVCEDVIEECDILLHVINTMLDISEAESGLTRSNIEEINLEKIVSQTTDFFKPVADDKKIFLKTKIGCSSLIEGDRRKLQRAISNLIDNALKYTDSGGEITVELSRENGTANIIVTDTGIGISPAELPKIFQRFYRGNKSRSKPGNGLGLSLALSVAHLHGGNLNVDSHEESGSKFTLTLPVSQ